MKAAPIFLPPFPLILTSSLLLLFTFSLGFIAAFSTIMKKYNIMAKEVLTQTGNLTAGMA